MKKFITLSTLLVLFAHSLVISQQRVLFIGNSYISYNNLPNMVAQCAASTGEELIFDSNLPGGSTLALHSSNFTTLEKINQGDWDYVVLQEQSQLPSFPEDQVEQEVFPFAEKLDSMIQAANPCAETMFYMTWGRKNGDASNCPNWPPVCTYAGMDSLLHLRYMQMAEDNEAVVSPVGAVWRYLRENHPNLELYNADNSHPSLLGSYAAACCFYAAIFRADPTLISWNSSLNAADANIIKAAAKVIVFDSIALWSIGQYDPKASFDVDFSQSPLIQFSNTSTNADNFAWFVDGVLQSNDFNFAWTPNGSAAFEIKLVASKCDLNDEHIELISDLGSFSNEGTVESLVYPNPFCNELFVLDPYLESLAILDLTGAVVYSFQGKNVVTKINLEGLSTGMYYLVINGEKRIRITKV